ENPEAIEGPSALQGNERVPGVEKAPRASHEISFVAQHAKIAGHGHANESDSDGRAEKRPTKPRIPFRLSQMKRRHQREPDEDRLREMEERKPGPIRKQQAYEPQRDQKGERRPMIELKFFLHR